MSRDRLIRFADLVGLDTVQYALRDWVRNGHAAQSLLLVGPEGVGKRSLACAWVAWLCCHSANKGSEACGSCKACKQLAAGTHPDVLWIGLPAGKREISIERARELKRFLALSSAEGSSRIAIIETAESMTVAAQNALLKTLEEPPSHAWLVLTTSAPDALLPTVRSRCRRIAVPPLPPDLVKQALERHGLAASEIDVLLPLAEGSVGRALQLRDTVSHEFARTAADFLAAIERARYSAIARFVEDLQRDDSAIEARLQMMLLVLRRQALEAWPDHPAAARAAVARADTLFRAWRTLREGYPNRPLLLESTLLEMARIQP